jgi:hypothetical protein
MRVKFGVAVVTAATALAIGAAPASADPPGFGCYNGDTLVFEMGAPGDKGWVEMIRLCNLEKSQAHPAPLKKV